MVKQAGEGALTPNLRFPEFRGGAEWKKDELKQVAFFVNEKMPLEQALLSNYVSTENILQNYDGVIAASKLPSISHLNKFKENDILVSNIRPYLKKIWVADKDGSCSNDVIVIRSNKINNKYLSFVIKNDIFIDYIMKGAKGVKMPRGDVSLIKEFLLGYPSIVEQQKIADCLSSIDDLITMQTQKLDRFKAHKKGLMRQLFPAEGETLPKLRFPEFRDKAEWEQKKLGQFATFFKGKGLSKSDIHPDGRTPCIRYGELYTHYNEIIKIIFSKTNYPISDLFMSHKNDVIIPSSGETKMDIATASCIILDGVALGSDLNVIRSNQNGIFISYCLNGPQKEKIAKIAQGDTVAHLYSSQLKELDVLIPGKAEQQKIADCLSSIDDLITTQTQKLDRLKNHKKGLMQQLFPPIDEPTP